LKVKKMLEHQPLTVFETCKLLFPKAYQRQLPLTISETVAQFDYLTDLEEINISNDNGVLRYTAS
jgi:hypothetical protein